MENVNDILTGLRIPAQFALDSKTFILHEALLQDLGIDDNLAYTYFKGLEVTCIMEGTKYKWEEMNVGETGLIPSNFIYPDGIIVQGIDYSNKEYNFRKINTDPGLQDVILTNGIINDDLLVNIINQKSLTFYSNGGTLLSLGGSDLLEPYFGRTYIGLGDNFSQPYVGFTFFDASTTFRDDRDNKGIVYHNDYSAQFTDLSLVNKKWVLDNIPDVDGSETKIDAGTNITTTGVGSDADPYIINAIDTNTTYTAGNGLLLTGTEFSLGNLQFLLTTVGITLEDSHNNGTFIIDNGSTPITIIVPDTLTISGFFCGFILKGTGDVDFVTSGTATIFNPIGYKIKGQGYQVAIEKNFTSNDFFLLGNTKV